jgi:predicted PurR-regulated permease PerM
MIPPTDRQARLMWLALSGLALAALAALGVALIWGLGRVVQLLSPVLWPLAVAGVLAYLLDPVVDLFVRKGLSRVRAIMMVFALALCVFGGLLAGIIPQVVNEARQLSDRIPAYMAWLEQHGAQWIEHPPEPLRRFLGRGTETSAPPTTPAPIGTTNQPGVGLTNIAVPAPAPATNAPSFLTPENLKSAATGAAGVLHRALVWLSGGVVSAIGFLAALVLIPVYTFYFLLEKEAISSHWTNYLPVTDSRFKNELVFVLNSINNYLITFFRGQVLVAITDGIMYGTGFLIIGLPYALFIGAAAVFLTIIPFIGAIIICLTALIIALVQFGDWQHPLLVLVVFGIVQALEGLIISPKIMGGRVGLHPVTIIIAVMFGTTLLGGLLGGILAIPLTAALRVVMFRYIWRRPNSEA